MAISYPVSLPASKTPRRVKFRASSTVGVAISPFTHEQQIYVHQGEWWEADIDLPPMSRADAEAWIGFLLSLNGREGTFLMGDPANASPRGTWNGTSPLVAGGAQTGKSLIVDGVANGVTALAGDWFQLGTGSSTRLHKVVQDATASGSPIDLRLEIWPRLRAAPADNTAVTLAAAKGLWRLKANAQEWDIDLAQVYGLSFSCEEAL